MKARVNQALKAEKGGEALEWRNDKTRASGSVTPLNRLDWNGMACRRLHIVNVVPGNWGEGVYKFCEKPPGRWKLVGPDGDPR
jgi:surface antigen